MMLKTFPLKPSFEENEDKDKVLKLGDDSLKLAEEEFKHAREIRSMEALKVKDDQIKLLSEQNNTLLRSLNRVSISFLMIYFQVIGLFLNIRWKMNLQKYNLKGLQYCRIEIKSIKT
jgi:hypothetical protein